MSRVILRVLGTSCAVTVLIVAAVCLSPIRWDIKTLGPVLPRTASESIPPGSSVLFVSEVNDWRAGHIARYGLDLVTFPAGRSAWLVFAEGFLDNEWPGDLLIDRSGQFYQRKSTAHATVPRPRRRSPPPESSWPAPVR
jgi:hypothetical protein